MRLPLVLLPLLTAVIAPAASAGARASGGPAVSGSAVQAGEAARSADSGRFGVRYRSAANVYLDAGRVAGLKPGDRLQLRQGTTVLAEVEVSFVAEQSASCRILSETRPLKPGDTLVRTAVAKAAPAAPATAPATGVAPALAPPTAVSSQATTAPAVQRPVEPRMPTTVRGSFSLGYYQSVDETEFGLDYTERTARGDIRVSDIGGQPLSFSLRGRSRQDVRSRRLSERIPKSQRSDRLCEAALRYEPPSDRFGVEAGRIGLYRFVGIGYLDGALARYRVASSLHVGAFGGRAAEIEGLGFNGAGAKYGAFVRFQPGGRWATRGFESQLAIVRENADGEVSREYLSIESRYSAGSRWSLFERAEVDLNRGWREQATGNDVQLSNVSLSGNLKITSSAWTFVSYDGRRNYRYYHNRLVPEEVFDDLLHQGLRAGINVSRPGGFGATAGFGMSLKEEDPRHPELNVANAYSFSGGLRHGGFHGLSLGVDGSGFSNGYTDGGLVNARIGRRFGRGHVVDVSYGRSFYRVKATEQDRQTQWIRLNGRVELGRRVYLSGDLEYDEGDDLQGPRALVEAGWIF